MVWLLNQVRPTAQYQWQNTNASRMYPLHDTTTSHTHIPPHAAPAVRALPSLDHNAWRPRMASTATTTTPAVPQRSFTNKPEHTVYSGPSAQSRITLKTIAEKHKRGERISMVTAYDYPSAVHVGVLGNVLVALWCPCCAAIHAHCSKAHCTSLLHQCIHEHV